MKPQEIISICLRLAESEMQAPSLKISEISEKKLFWIPNFGLIVA